MNRILRYLKNTVQPNSATSNVDKSPLPESMLVHYIRTSKHTYSYVCISVQNVCTVRTYVSLDDREEVTVREYSVHRTEVRKYGRTDVRARPFESGLCEARVSQSLFS